MTDKKNRSASKSSQEVAPKGPPADAPKSPRQVRINFEPKDKIRLPRAGSKRALVVELFRGDGATVEGVQEAIVERFGESEAWDRRTALEGIRLVHHQCGFGLSTDENGVITAQGEVTPVEVTENADEKAA